MKETIRKVKRQPSEWEKIIVNEATAEVANHWPPSLVLLSTGQPRRKTFPYSLAVWSALKLNSGQRALSLRAVGRGCHLASRHWPRSTCICWQSGSCVFRVTEQEDRVGTLMLSGSVTAFKHLRLDHSMKETSFYQLKMLLLWLLLQQPA